MSKMHSREEFIKAYDQVADNQMFMLSYSLPHKETKELDAMCRRFKELVRIAGCQLQDD